MYMQVCCYVIMDSNQQYATIYTRVEAHLALVMFRPHSILKGGIKTQTQLHLMVENLFSLLWNSPTCLSVRIITHFLESLFCLPDVFFYYN